MATNDPITAETAERCVLGGLLLDNSLLAGPLSQLSVSDFYLSANKVIFATCLELAEQGTSFDDLLITEVLEERGLLEQVGGSAYLFDIQNGVVTHASRMKYHAQSIIRASRLRNLRLVGAALEQQAGTPGADDNILFDKYRDVLSKLADGYDLDGNLTPVIPRNLKRRADIVRLDQVEAREVDWLWRPYLPLGMLTMFSGDPSVGKSYAALAAAAAFSNGRTPYSGEICTPRDTLYLTVENSAEYVLRPRFDLLEGRAERLHLLRGSITGPDGDHLEHGGVCLSDIALLGEALERTKASFVVIDPIQSFLGSEVDMHRANETRPVLDGLVRLAEKHHCSILLLRHLAKAQAGRAIHRGLGTIDFSGAVRTEMLLGVLADNSKRRAIAHLQSNVGPIGGTIGYEIDELGHFYWKDASDITVAAMLAPEADPDEKSAFDEAAEFLSDALSKGPMKQKAIVKEARALGIALRTLERAKTKLKIKARKPPEVDAPWQWEMP